jgi:hypothetical protein
MAIGARDLSLITTLTGWDADVLNNFRLEDQTTYAAVAAQLNAALTALNTEFNSDWMTNMYSLTSEPELEYRDGVSNGFLPFTEYARADWKRANTIGHMLPLQPMDRMLGWTWRYLNKSRISQIEADIADSMKDARDIRRQRILARVLKRGDDSGTALQLGSSALSPGFATTAGSTGVDYVPPAFGGTTFANTHEHYVAIAGGVFTNAVFTDAKDELREHGHEPTYEFLIGPADESTVRGLSDFTPVAETLVMLGSTQDVARMPVAADGTSWPIGTIHDFFVRVVHGIPQYYGLGYKSYGRLSQRNPLRIRLPKNESTWRVVAMADPNGGSGQNPLQDLMLFTEFGVGVFDRTAGTPRYVNNSSWSDGTAT